MAGTIAVVRPRLVAIRQHIRGVKQRLLLVCIAFGLGSGLAWYFRSAIIGWLLLPAHGQLSQSGRPIFISPTEMLSLVISLTMRAGIVVAFPVAVYHIYRLLRPLLNKQQRRFVVIFLPAGFVCYLLGAAFAYFVLLPTGINFLMQFGTDVADPTIRITEYMGLVLAMLFWLGIVFELPLAMFLLAKLRVVSYQRIKKFRRYVPLAALFFGAIITPTADIVNSMLVTVPIILLFEFGAFLAWLARAKKERKA